MGFLHGLFGEENQRTGAWFQKWRRAAAFDAAVFAGPGRAIDGQAKRGARPVTFM
jgi:hypothetical protein